MESTFEVTTGTGAEVCPIVPVSLQLIHAGVRQCDKGCRLDSVGIYIIDPIGVLDLEELTPLLYRPPNCTAL